MNEDAYTLLKKQIARHLDLDIDAYKQRQMRRRLDTWVDQHVAGSDIEAFINSLAFSAPLLQNLRDTLTINVTEFFRDQAQWNLMEQQILPELTSRSQQLKIWSAGCSSGDEPYSLAILLDEATRGATTSVLATDLDPASLIKAKAGGPYSVEALKNVNAARRAKYFRQEGTQFFMQDALRRRIEFRSLNLLKDRFTPGYDLVMCRNVTIYFDPPVKAALTRRFYGSLNPGGYLFIGATEALLGQEADGFTRTGGNFYRKTEEPARRIQAA